MEFIKNIDLNKETRLNYLKKNLKTRLLGDNGFCEGHVLKISTFPKCYAECKKDPTCSAIRYNKDKYCDLLSSCKRARDDPNWKIKILRHTKNNKNPFTQFPLRIKTTEDISSIPIHILLLQNFCILIIISIFFYQLYNFFKIIYITLPDIWKYKNK
jgi:hypothetical protein